MKISNIKIGLFAFVITAASMVQVAQAQWSVTGNAATDTAVNFIGTTDSKGLKIKTNSLTRMYIDKGGKIGIGTLTPQTALDLYSASASTAFGIRSDGGSAFIFMDKQNSTDNATVSYRTDGVALWQTGTFLNNDFAIKNLPLGNSITVLNSNNFVGIGTTAPITQLHVVGDGRIQGNLNVTNNSSFGASMNVNGSINATGNVFFGDTINFGTAENFYDAGTNTIGTNDNFLTQRTLSVGTSTQGDSTFNVAGSAAISGNTAIGGIVIISGKATLSDGLKVLGGINVVSGDISSGGDIYTSAGNGVINCGGDSMNGNINIMSDFFTSGTSNLNANGDEDLYIGGDLEVVGKGFQTGGGAWGVRSDKRLKKDIADFNDGLEQLMKIHPVKFKYNDLFPNHTEKEYVGIIAQEMQEIAPYMVEELPMGQVVEEDANGKEVIVNPGKNYLSFDPNALWYITVNAIKEQQSIIEKQEERIVALEAKLNQSTRTERNNSTNTVYRLAQNTPNPFNQSTTINYNCGDAKKALIIVRDLNGNLMKSINAVGKTQVAIDANELAQGTYTYTLEIAGVSIDTKLMVVTK